MSFAELYIANEHIGRATIDNRVEPLKEPWDAAYFSVVTITTLGYGITRHRRLMPASSSSANFSAARCFCSLLFRYWALGLRSLMNRPERQFGDWMTAHGSSGKKRFANPVSQGQTSDGYDGRARMIDAKSSD